MKFLAVLALSAVAWGQCMHVGYDGVRKDVPCAARSITTPVFTISQLTLASTATLDALSSRDRYEINPAFPGPFGARQAAISLGITGAFLLSERPIIKRWPATQRWFTWLNFGTAGIHAAAASYNLGEK